MSPVGVHSRPDPRSFTYRVQDGPVGGRRLVTSSVAESSPVRVRLTVYCCGPELWAGKSCGGDGNWGKPPEAGRSDQPKRERPTIRIARVTIPTQCSRLA